ARGGSAHQDEDHSGDRGGTGAAYGGARRHAAGHRQEGRRTPRRVFGLIMGSTVIQKILARAGGGTHVAPGDIAVVKVDTAVLLDTNFMPHVWRDVLGLADPDKVVVVFDHKVPANTRVSAQGHMTGRDFVKRFGIRRFHDLG